MVRERVARGVEARGCMTPSRLPCSSTPPGLSEDSDRQETATASRERRRVQLAARAAASALADPIGDKICMLEEQIRSMIAAIAMVPERQFELSQQMNSLQYFLLNTSWHPMVRAPFQTPCATNFANDNTNFEGFQDQVIGCSETLCQEVHFRDFDAVTEGIGDSGSVSDGSCATPRSLSAVECFANDCSFAAPHHSEFRKSVIHSTGVQELMGGEFFTKDVDMPMLSPFPFPTKNVGKAHVEFLAGTDMTIRPIDAGDGCVCDSVGDDGHVVWADSVHDVFEEDGHDVSAACVEDTMREEMWPPADNDGVENGVVGHEGWEIISPEPVNVRKRNSIHARILTSKDPGEIVFGIERGNWLKLTNEPGFIVKRGVQTGELLVEAIGRQRSCEERCASILG